MPRGARVLRSQPGLWGGGRGSGPACAPPGRGRECLTCPRQAGTWPASLVLFSMGRVGYCGAMCHGGAHPARGFRHGLLAPFAGDLEGGRSNVTTLSCWHSVLVSVTARSRGGCCSSRPHGTFGERPGGDCTGRSFSCDQQRAGFPSAPPWALWGVALLRPRSDPLPSLGFCPPAPLSCFPKSSGRDGGLSSSFEVTVFAGLILFLLLDEEKKQGLWAGAGVGQRRARGTSSVSLPALRQPRRGFQQCLQSGDGLGLLVGDQKGDPREPPARTGHRGFKHHPSQQRREGATPHMEPLCALLLRNHFTAMTGPTAPLLTV